jgi:hypothetical protein
MNDIYWRRCDTWSEILYGQELSDGPGNTNGRAQDGMLEK